MTTNFAGLICVFLCLLIFDSCKKEEDFSIEIENTVFNRKSGVWVNAFTTEK